MNGRNNRWTEHLSLFQIAKYSPGGIFWDIQLFRCLVIMHIKVIFSTFFIRRSWKHFCSASRGRKLIWLSIEGRSFSRGNLHQDGRKESSLIFNICVWSIDIRGEPPMILLSILLCLGFWSIIKRKTQRRTTTWNFWLKNKISEIWVFQPVNSTCRNFKN